MVLQSTNKGKIGYKKKKKKKLTSVRRTYKECLNNKETYSQTQTLNSKNGPTFVAVFAKVS